MTADLSPLSVSASLPLRSFLGSPLTDGVKAAERAAAPLPHLTSKNGGARPLWHRTPNERPTLRHGRPPRSAGAAAQRRDHLEGGHLGQRRVVSLGWPASRRFLGSVWSVIGAAGGGGEGEPTLPALLSGRCQCKCQGDVPTQAGESAAPVPERNNA